MQDISNISDLTKSGRSIEGENPLYLPQAKTYDASAAIGPGIYVTDEPLPKDSKITLEILRNNQQVFKDDIEFSQMKRKPEELMRLLFPRGSRRVESRN